MFLKDLLAVSSANMFKIKNLDTGKIVFNASKSDEAFEEIQERYAYYNVHRVRPSGEGHGLNNIKYILIIEIQEISPL